MWIEESGSQDTGRSGAWAGTAAERIGGLLLGGACAGLCGCGSEPTRPNVLLVVLDALHAGHVSHLGYGRETTPNLDRLAAEGFTCEQAFSHAPYTLASIPSILVGRLPQSHGLVDKGYVLPAAEVTIAEHLGAAGYETLGAVANLNGSEVFDLHQGFERFENLLLPNAERPATFTNTRTGESFHEAKASEFTDLFEGWLAEGAGGDGPALFYMHVLEPHTPYTPPAPFFDRYREPDYTGPFAAGDTESLIASLAADAPEVTQADIQGAIDLYDANLAYADHELGRWVALLDEYERSDSTLVAVTSDHGEAFWQHGVWGHNETLYDEMLRVPLVVRPPAALTDVARWPYPAAGARIRLPVGSVDILPGLCDWLGLDLPNRRLDGLSLAKLVHTERLDRQLIARSNAYNPSVSLRGATTKSIVHIRPAGTPLENLEHYQLDSDPNESEDLAARLDRRAAAGLIQRAEELFRVESENRVGRGRDLTTGEQAILRRLGYSE